jgi:hypothetical protein
MTLPCRELLYLVALLIDHIRVEMYFELLLYGRLFSEVQFQRELGLI